MGVGRAIGNLKEFLSRDFAKIPDEDTTLHGDGCSVASAAASPTRPHALGSPSGARQAPHSYQEVIHMAKKKRAAKKAGKKTKKKARRKSKKM
jgi:hypothetical protein